jgi:hypothetical protein
MPDNNRLRATGPVIVADVGPSSYSYIAVVMGGGNPRGSFWHSASALAPLTAPVLRHYLEPYDPSANAATAQHSHPLPAAMLCATRLSPPTPSGEAVS